jgi:hypothetical protein
LHHFLAQLRGVGVQQTKVDVHRASARRHAFVQARGVAA